MKKLFTVSLIVFLLMIFLSTLSISAPLPEEPDTATKLKVIDSFGKLPLSFTENRGQINNLVSHYLKGRGGTIYFTKESIVYKLLSEKVPHARDRRSKKSRRLSFTLRPLGAEKTVKLLSQKRLPGRVNYLIGDDPKDWHTNIPLHEEIIYKGLYKGIDLKIYGTNNQMEYDFILSPGADPKVITMACEGIEVLSVDKNGDLLIETPLGDIKHLRPLIYQEIEGTRHLIDGTFKVAENTFSFDIGNYNKDYALIIDPLTLSYSTYLGGSGRDSGSSIAVDSSGAAYVTGLTASTDFPTNNSYQGTYGGGDYDAFVAKLSPDGANLVYSTYLGGSGRDNVYSIAADSSGSAYVTGYTNSTDFPTVNAYQGTYGGGDYDAFVAKLSPDGANLVYSTYLGGSGRDSGSSIAIVTSGIAYITGDTNSTDFPTTNAYKGTYGGGSFDAFATKFSPTGSSISYSTYLGGSKSELGNAIAVDSSGNAYIIGTTESTDFPTNNAYQGTYGGEGDAFITKLSPTGNTLSYSTYLGGSYHDWGSSIAVDSSGSAYITGDTNSTDFPTTNAYQGTYGEDWDAFVTKLSPTGNTLSYSTYLGGNAHDRGMIIAVDTSGAAYVTGLTASTNFPTTNAYQGTYGGGDYDAFVTKLSPTGNTLSYSTYLGGSGWDDGYSIAVDTSGAAYVTGLTASTDFPTNNAYQGTYGGGDYDAFVTKFEIPQKHYWHVDGTAASPGDGTSWDNAFMTVQAAIDAAGKDDEIWLKKGTYELSSQVTIDKAVAIYGGFSGGETQRNQRDWSKNVTTVDGQGSVYHCFYVTTDATIDGLTITAGNANRSWPDNSGGGVYIYQSSPSITNCTILKNSADFGGGIYNRESSSIIKNCLFKDNSAISHGGGIENYKSSPTIDYCTISENSVVMWGGGIYNRESSPTITNCSFTGNTSKYGGGILNDTESSSSINNCSFTGNSATNSGGGMYIDTSSAILTNCSLSDNKAIHGGAIYNYNSSSTIVNCILSKNIATNYGGGIRNKNSSTPAITNCILWANTAPDGPEISNDDTSNPIITYCDVQGGYGGKGNINNDPLFVDPSNYDFHLQATSPCIDKGNNSAPGIPNTDFEGDTRTVDGDNDGTATVDMGMDEYTLIDTDSDGLSDDWEMTYFGDLSQGPDGDYDGDGATNLEEYQAGTDPANNPPTADAGPDQTVDEGDTVTLDGSSSSDPDDGIASYLWTQTDGPSINLSDPTSSKPSFTATSEGTLQFELKVTDKSGLTSIDTATITIKTPVISDGDVAPFGNRDGIVNVGDALVALRFALLLETPTQENIAHGDVAPLDAQGKPDPDGIINVGDALVILRKALGIIFF